MWEAPSAATAAPSAVSAQPSGGCGATAAGPAFLAAPAFAGVRAGYVFSSGAQGTGYYLDGGPLAAGVPALSGAAAAALGRRKTAGAYHVPS